MFKSAMLGCGGRARGHAAAYAHVRQSTLAAVCDMDRSRLDPFAEEYGVPARYTDSNSSFGQKVKVTLHNPSPVGSAVTDGGN